MDLILIIIILVVPLIADIFVKTTYRKYLKVENKKELTGQEVARKILDKNGLESIYVVQTGGVLTDHYDPKRKVVRLSQAVYDGHSVASLAIASHECGHAIQDKEGYFFLRLRSFIYPVVNIATSISYYIILIGFIFELLDLVYIGIAFTSLGLLFQIITLPVEFNASKRAGKEIDKLKIASSDEKKGVKKVLTSAAFTYVAGVLASAVQILRLLFIARDRD
ncbi:MAG: zinc metallopeptidase [Bacilli bacterium]